MNPFRNRSVWISDWMLVAYVAGVSLILHLVAITRFGIFRDELYYIDCSNHLAFGYVDHPPLSILILKGVRLLFGDSLVALRILPVLGGAAFIVMTAWIARLLGGKKIAVFLAAATAFAAVGNHFNFHIFSMNFLDVLFWLVCFLLIIKIIQTGNRRLWIPFGIIAGLGLQNKISVLFLLFGTGVGILLTRERRNLKSRAFWTGMSLAAVLFLPYLIWNGVHGWPHLEFIRNAKAFKMAAVSPPEFFLGQLLFNNPPTFLLWGVGLWFFLFSRQGKHFRLFGWMYISISILFTIQQAKDYYLAAVYPLLFAGGAVLWEHWTENKAGKTVRPVILSFVLVSGLLLFPISVPILSPAATAAGARFFGATEHSGEKHEFGELPQYYADMFGWEDLAGKVANVYLALPEDEKEQCVIFGQNYGEAGAVNFFGRKSGLPPAHSGHNNHFYWEPDVGPDYVMIMIGGKRKRLEHYFDEVTLKDRTSCRYCMPYENNNPIFLCRHPKQSFRDIWLLVKHFE